MKQLHDHKKKSGRSSRPNGELKKNYFLLKNGLLFILSAVSFLVFMGCLFSKNNEDAKPESVTPQYKDGTAMKPALFDIRANAHSASGVPLVKPWKRISLDPEYAGAWIVAGDVDGDGQAEIVSARNVNENDNHYTCSVVAQHLDGTVLWHWGNPQIGHFELSHDVACQIYDWDGDGANEIVVAGKESVIELNGKTGKEKRNFAIPQNASDCIVFANLSGNKRASDILIKTRYGQIWAYNYAGKLLWTIEKPAGYRTAHQPYPIDIDHDGKDEIVAGYALLNPNGTIRWDLKDQGLSLGKGHLDCARILHAGKNPLNTDLVLSFCGDNHIAKVNGEGKLIWGINGMHFESIDVGKVCNDVSGNQIIVDIDHSPFGESPVWVLNEKGDLLGRIVTNYSRRHMLVDWFGNGTASIVIGSTATMFDGHGNKVAIFDTPATSCFKGDITGDHIPDIIFTGNREVYIFKNEKGKKSDNYITLGTGVNFTLY